MAQGQGYDAYVGLGVQSAVGTLVARTKFNDFISESLEINHQFKAWNNAGQNAPRVISSVGRHSEGSLEMYGDFESCVSWFKAAFGASSVTTAAVNGAGFSHTYALKDAMPTGGLSVEVVRSVATFLYEGCKVDQLEFMQDSADFLKIRCALRGRNETQVSTTSPTFLTARKVDVSQLVLKVATVAQDLTSFRLTLANNLTGFRAKIDGTTDSKEFIRGNKRAVSGVIGLSFEDLTRYNEFRAETEVALEFKYTGAVMAGSTDTYQLKLSLPRCRWEGKTPNVGGAGPIEFELPFVAMETTRGANDELALYIQNLLSSVT